MTLYDSDTCLISERIWHDIVCNDSDICLISERIRYDIV